VLQFARSDDHFPRFAIIDLQLISTGEILLAPLIYHFDSYLCVPD
jgi:hypothetical protein